MEQYTTILNTLDNLIYLAENGKFSSDERKEVDLMAKEITELIKDLNNSLK